MSGSDYTVTVNCKEVVRSLSPMQEHWLPLSNLDLFLPPIDVSVFFCYNKPNKSSCNFNFALLVSTLKEALAQALVPYYPFAGELLRNTDGKPVVLCNNRGVDFIEAHANVQLKHIDLYKPDASVEGKFLPKRNQGVLCVQVTELQCGGFVVACTFDHSIADAFSMNMFLVAWAEIAQEKPISLMPTFERSLLRPSHKLKHYDASLDNMCVQLSTWPSPCKRPNPNNISRIYYISGDSISRLQSLANYNNVGHQIKSKLVSFSAFLWQVFAKGTGDKTIKRFKMGIVVDGRARLARKDDEHQELHNYVGNVISFPAGELSIDELRNKMPLSSVSDQVQEFLRPSLTKEHFLGLIDWIQAHHPRPTSPRIYFFGSEDEEALIVSSGQRFPVVKVDFGWGRPCFGSYYLVWGSPAGYVMPMPSPRGNGDWMVFMHCNKDHLEYLEKEFGDVFTPFSSQYLDLV